jgi:serine/threonine protein kinase
MASKPCPEDPELLAMAMGSTVPEPVRLHVDDCADCRLRVDRLRAELSAVRNVAAELPVAGGAATAAVAAIAETTSEPSATESPEEDFEDPEPTEPRARPESIGRYRVVGELDSGGQAEVYRAVHPTLPRDLAIKIAHEPSAIDRSLLRGDAEVLCELDHPNLVRVHDLDIHDGRPFVVMEFVRGRNLHQVAEQARPSPYQAAAWVAEIARALAYVHGRGVVHQDVKPKNIMLDESGRPRLIDFGMARWRHAWSGRRAGPSGGTLAFMAPEQARGESKRVGEPSDLFGLGGVLYYLLTGKTPFGGGTRNEQWRRASQCDFDREALRAKGVPRRLERIVLKAMAAEPEDRYASAVDLADALDDFARRPRRLALEAAALLLAALAVVAWSLWLRPAWESNPKTTAGSAPHATPIRPEPAPSVAGPPPTPPLRIESLQVELHGRVPGDPVGIIGVNIFAGRLDEDVRVRAQLGAPGYCYLIALNPDGSVQPCYPGNSRTVPSSTTEIDFPNEPGSGFGLTEGAGTQVFVLIASAKPLPSYDEWSWRMGDPPWKPARTDTVWRYDGRRFESDRERGEVRPLAHLPPSLDAACRALQAGHGVEAIRAVAFPVKAAAGDEASPTYRLKPGGSP